MLLSSLWERRAAISTTHPRDPVLAEWFGGRESAAGVNVTPDTSMQVIAVLAAVRLIAETIGSLPFALYERRADGGSDIAASHPLHRILHDQPNAWQTSCEFREMMTGHVALRGNAYAYIQGSGGSAVSALIPMHPDRTRPYRVSETEIAYEYYDEQGSRRIFLQEEVFHLRGFGSDGLMGLSPIDLARESIGLAMAAEEFGARFFGNSTVASGVLESPGVLDDKAYDRLKTDWAARRQGLRTAHNPIILEDGLKWHQLGIEPEKAQFLETRKFQVTEIARLFRVPPHLIGDVEKSTSWGTGIEQQNIGFVQFSLMPYLIRWEQGVSRDLVVNKKRYYAKHRVQGLMRGDAKSRSEFYSSMWNIGALSIDEIRGFEDMNPIEGGDQRFVPLNMQLLDQAGAGNNDDGMRGAVYAHRPAFVQAFDKAVVAETRKLRKAMADGLDRLEETAVALYEKHGEFIRRNLQPCFDALVQSLSVSGYTVDASIDLVLQTYIRESQQALICVLPEGEQRVSEMLDTWEQHRAAQFAERALGMITEHAKRKG